MLCREDTNKMSVDEVGGKKETSVEESSAPVCHDEPMQQIYRYKENDVIYCVWRCNFCFKTSTLPVYGGKK